jgi:PadR family transcriptional regulator, regulatory protein PadR
MWKDPPENKLELAYGSLDLMVLQTLVWGEGIAKSIQRRSDDAFRVDHGSLYPALQRLLQEGWIGAQWGVTENNQRAKYYQLTVNGRKKLTAETSRWMRFAQAVTCVLRPAEEAEE